MRLGRGAYDAVEGEVEDEEDLVLVFWLVFFFFEGLVRS